MAKNAQGGALARDAELMRKLGLQLSELKEMGLAGLRAKHVELFGEEARSKNLDYLRKRLAFRLQEQVHGGLSPEARAKVEELAPAELPAKRKDKRPGKSVGNSRGSESIATERDPRLPEPGTVIQRAHKGFVHEVEVLEEGFCYRGRSYRSLSAIAKEITGTAWNGFGFFGLLKRTGHGEA